MTDETAKWRKRHGIKVPRSTLLPPYMSVNPYFVAYCDAMDSVYGETVDAELHTLSNIRNTWVQNPETEVFAEAGELMPTETWSVPNRDLIVKQVNALGLKLQTAGIVTDDAYQTISRFVGQYWFGKGTVKFIEFINYCLSSDFRVYNMWTENYVDFFAEGEPEIGTPIWEGGTWYPTTHVLIEALGGLQGIDIRTLQQFFYEVANYNLVLRAIDARFDLKVVDSVSQTETRIIAVAMVVVQSVVLANFKDMSAPPPPSSTGFAKPTTYYAMGGMPVDFASTVMLGGPNAWAYVDEERTMKVPVYNAQTFANQPAVGLNLIGAPDSGNHHNLLVGSISWVPLPTDPGIQIPTFNTGSYVIEDSGQVETQIVGSRSSLLTNPAGFYEVQPGRFVPYWL